MEDPDQLGFGKHLGLVTELCKAELIVSSIKRKRRPGVSRMHINPATSCGLFVGVMSFC